MRVQPKDMQKNSVETIVCEAMGKLKSVPMDDHTTSVMLKFMMDINSEAKADEIVKQIWQAEAIKARMLAQFGRELDSRCAILIVMWAKSIGSSLLYMYYMQWMCRAKGIQGKLTMDHLVEIFPMGFFADEDLHTIWDTQKVDNRRENFDTPEQKGSDNLIDYAIASMSIGGMSPETEAENVKKSAGAL